MRIVIDGRALEHYKGWSVGEFHAGTEGMVHHLARGLAQRGHMVHVVTPDLPIEQQRGPNEWWWGPQTYPRVCDVLVLVHGMKYLPMSGINAALVVMATNSVDPAVLLPEDHTRQVVDAWPVFTKFHGDLLQKSVAAVDPAKVFVTGLGVEPVEYQPSEYGRLFFANDPQRGLWHVLDIYDRLRLLVPEATLHVGYEFDRQFEPHRWAPSAMAEMLWECKARIEYTPGITKLGPLTHEELVREQCECQVHVMPSDPPNVGSQLHGLTQLECAAAGAALVVSDTEAFPEIFGDAAEILPLPGAFVPSAERRCDAQDWADVVAGLMLDGEKWAEASRKARALAEQHTWDAVCDRWNVMLETLANEPVGEGVLIGRD